MTATQRTFSLPNGVIARPPRNGDRPASTDNGAADFTTVGDHPYTATPRPGSNQLLSPTFPASPMPRITSILTVAITLAVLTAGCSNADTVTLTTSSPDHLPTPNRGEVILIGEQAPPDVTSRQAKRFYQNGFRHMQDAEWDSAVAAYSEVIHLHAKAASAYAARGTAHLCGGNHEDDIMDYTTAIAIAPDNPSYWRRRAHAWSAANPPDPKSAIADATQVIELDPTHHMGYGRRAVAYTLLPTPHWQAALEDMDRSIPLHPQHDSEAYKMRAWIHDNFGNHAEADETGNSPFNSPSATSPPTANTQPARNQY